MKRSFLNGTRGLLQDFFVISKTVCCTMNKYTVVAVLILLSATIESISAIKWTPPSANITIDLDTGAQATPFLIVLSKSLKGDPDFSWQATLSNCKYLTLF